MGRMEPAQQHFHGQGREPGIDAGQHRIEDHGALKSHHPSAPGRGHGDNSGPERHGGHEGHVDHVGQFRRLFRIMLVLAIPVVLLSGMFAMILGYSLPEVPAWVSPILGTIMCVWGGKPFLTGARASKDPSTMKHSLSLASLSVAALITLSACGSSPDAEGMGDTGEEGSVAATSEATAEHNQADLMFTRMMIPHHEQAVEMSDLMLSKDDISPEIEELATRIKDAQGPEIETMTSWLEAWDDAMGPTSMESEDMGGMNHGGGDTDGHAMGSGSEHMDGTDGMEGMMSEDRMSELASAEGIEASRLFLESMTAHHDGAVEMAQDEIDNGRNPEVIELARMVVTTQQAEIAAMKELLAGL